MSYSIALTLGKTEIPVRCEIRADGEVSSLLHSKVIGFFVVSIAVHVMLFRNRIHDWGNYLSQPLSSNRTGRLVKIELVHV